ncbi:transcription factor SEF1 [Fusarium pseudocircinatum]|uniref:Transcription factor SEF1 n=1 Tax=Fusarium pseudocircinatum TaxID=56676 RepID=A0A8H5KQN5_9HYPO|nr:transcription factor SEF1 [Fusarium pseudocircinatum]
MSQEPSIPSSVYTRTSSPSSNSDSQYSIAPICTAQDTAAASVGGCTKDAEPWLQLKRVDIPSSYQLGSLNLNNTVALDLFHHLSEFLGFPSLFSSGYYLKSVSRARERASSLLDPSCYTVLEIRQLTMTSIAKLDMITDSALHFSQIQSSINDLDLLRSSGQHSWNPETELTFQGAKLYLYAMTLLSPPTKESVIALQAIYNRDAALISGLMSASTMISDILQQIRDKPTQSTDEITCIVAFWPKTHISYLFFAATFIFRVLLSHSSLTPQNITLAMSRLADTHAICRIEPLHPDRTRAGEIIQRLIEVARAYVTKDEGENDAKPLLPRGLLVTGRLGASAMFDAVLRSVHYQKQCTQSRKSRPRNETGISQADGPAYGREQRVGGKASSNAGLISQSQSAEPFTNMPDRAGAIGLGDLFEFDLMDPYEYIMSTDSSLMYDVLHDPGFGNL